MKPNQWLLVAFLGSTGVIAEEAINLELLEFLGALETNGENVAVLLEEETLWNMSDEPETSKETKTEKNEDEN